MTAVHMPKPKRWQDFECAMLTLMQCVLGDPEADIIGSENQAQNGVDIHGTRKGKIHTQSVGVQCKKHWEKKVTEGELRTELAKAKRFKPPLDVFILATTARRDEAIQQVARTLTEAERSSAHPILVYVWGWQQIEERVAKHTDARKAFDPDFTSLVETVGEDIKATVVRVGGELRSRLDAAQAASPSSHDLDLLGRFRAMAPQATRDFLWKHTFRGGTLRAQLEPFDEMAETFQGLDNEFDDAEVQAAFAPVMTALAGFVDLAGDHLHSDDRHPHVLTPQTDDDRRNRVRTQATRNRVAQIEASARRLFELMETFLRLARERISS